MVLIAGSVDTESCTDVTFAPSPRLPHLMSRYQEELKIYIEKRQFLEKYFLLFFFLRFVTRKVTKILENFVIRK